MPVSALGVYLPPWENRGSRVPGGDEDAVTMAVAVGLPLVEASPSRPIRKVVLITRDFPLLEGGNGAALLAGLGLGNDTEVVEVLGGAPAALDALAESESNTLVIGVDARSPAGGGAGLIDATGLGLGCPIRINRSLPVHTRSLDGSVRDYDDPRLLRVRGVGASLETSGLDPKGAVIAGLCSKDVAAFSGVSEHGLPTLGASSPFFALARLVDLGEPSLLLAVEDAVLSAADVEITDIFVHKTIPPPQPLGAEATSPGPEIKLSLAAYERAFESKLRWQAGACRTCGSLSFPARFRCLECGSEAGTDAVVLPRGASIYTVTTIRVQVPGLVSPYSLGVVEMDKVGVRALVHITGVPAGAANIGDHGELVFRKVAVRSGVPDYGYAFLPETRLDKSEMAEEQ